MYTYAYTRLHAKTCSDVGVPRATGWGDRTSALAEDFLKLANDIYNWLSAVGGAHIDCWELCLYGVAPQIQEIASGPRRKSFQLSLNICCNRCFGF